MWIFNCLQVDSFNMDTLITVLITTLGMCSSQQILKPQNAEVLEYADVLLTCKGFMTRRRSSWVWTGSNNQQFHIETMFYGECYPREFRVNETLYSVFCDMRSTGVLLRNVTRSRHGERWECQQDFQNSSTSAIVFVIVISVQMVPVEKTIPAKENTRVQLSCSTSLARPAPNITWLLTKERLDIENDTQFMNENDVQVTNDTEGLFSSRSTILFNVNRSFDGQSIYCSASNYPGTSVVSAKTKFDIKYPAQVTDFYVKGYHGDREDAIHVGENDTLEIICLFDRVASVAKIKFQWNGVLFEVSNTTNVTYTIGKVSCMDAGYYTCVGRNEYNYGRPSMRHITLIVNCKPQLHPGLLMQDSSSAELGGTVTFRLDILAYPEPSHSDVIWMKLTHDNTTLLTNSVHTEISIKELQATLKIRHVTNEDYGNYQITVTNELGTYRHTFNLEHVPGKNDAHINITGAVVGSVAGFMVFVVVIGIVIFLSRKIYQGRGLPFISNKKKDNGGNHLSTFDETVQDSSIPEASHTYDRIQRDGELEGEYQQIQLENYENKCVYKNIQFPPSATS